MTVGITYYYWVEHVDMTGAATRHGPVSVVYRVPTAVKVSGLDISAAPEGGVLPLAGVLWALLLVLAGVAVLWRRLEHDRTK